MNDSPLADFYADALERLMEYIVKHNRVLIRGLGGGMEGVVFLTQLRTAIKAHRFRENYTRERDVYLRLFERQVYEVNGFQIPELGNFDDELMILEIAFVTPPFILDFAGA